MRPRAVRPPGPSPREREAQQRYVLVASGGDEGLSTPSPPPPPSASWSLERGRGGWTLLLVDGASPVARELARGGKAVAPLRLVRCALAPLAAPEGRCAAGYDRLGTWRGPYRPLLSDTAGGGDWPSRDFG